MSKRLSRIRDIPKWEVYTYTFIYLAKQYAIDAQQESKREVKDVYVDEQTER